MKKSKLFTLIKKDFKLTLNNKTILLLFALPLIFAIIYPLVLKDQIEAMGPNSYVFLLSMISVLGIAAVSISSVGTSIAEEKEKKTMRSLTLSNVSALEFVGSKIIVMLFLFIMDMILCFFLVSAPTNVLPLYLLLLVFSTSAMLLIGASVGLVAETQQSVGVMAMPLMFLAMAPIITMSINHPIADLFTKYSPTGPLVSLMTVNSGASLPYEYSYFAGILCLVIWNIIGIITFIIFFKKQKKDN